MLGEKREPIREAVVHHSYDGMFSIRQGEWKLILGHGSGGFSQPRRIETQPGDVEGQLHNLARDPNEDNDVYDAHREIVARLAALLEKYRDNGHSRPL